MSRSEETKSFRFNHTMYRVKDPQKSLHFYQEILGMELIDKAEFSSFTLYFLAFDHSGGSDDVKAKKLQRFKREGVLELTHNHGTESDASFAGYASGNDEPGKGYGHIAITVDDVHAACARFETLGVPFKKRLTDGTMKNIAFIKDPDGYWVEILPNTYEV